MKTLLAFLAGAFADQVCDTSWYFQQGRQYNYEISTSTSLMLSDKGFNSENELNAAEDISGSLQLSVVGDCVGEAVYRSRQAPASKARIQFGSGAIQSVAFPQGQSAESNNNLKAIFSALQFSGEGLANHPTTVGEMTHNGFTQSLYQCGCGCTDCTCDQECNKYTVVRQPKMAIAQPSGSNAILESLFGKISVDSSLAIDMGEVNCQYELTKGTRVPKHVQCEQTIKGDEINAILSSITIALESDESARRGLIGNSRLGPDDSLKVEEIATPRTCLSDRTNCLVKRFNNVIGTTKDAATSQFLLRREIKASSDSDLMAILNSAQLTPNALSYLFKELALCPTAACDVALSYLANAGTIDVYPTVYRAVQLQDEPSEILIEMIAADLERSSSVEKLNILLSAIKKNPVHDFNTCARAMSNIIGQDCATIDEDTFSVLGYFASQTETTESEMVLALKIVQQMPEEVAKQLVPKVNSCLSYSGKATILENAILAIAPFYNPEELISNIHLATHEATAAMIVALVENHNLSVKDMYRLFAAKYNIESDKVFIKQMLLALDNTSLGDEEEPTVRLSRTMDLVLPSFMNEVELFSGMNLETTVEQSKASVTVVTELKNGEGFRLVEARIVINSVYDMMKFAVSGYYRCPEQLWEDVLATENSLISLVESAINMQFENIVKNGGLAYLKSYLQLGGVQVKLVGEEIDPSWILETIENIKLFIESDSSARKTPTLAEVYNIFSNGIETKFFHIFDNRHTMGMSTVSGVAISSTVAQITNIDYNGNIIPHLSTLGDSGDVQIAPAFTTALIKETHISSSTIKKTAASVKVGHVSFAAELNYNKAASGIKMRMRIAPTKSPLTLYNWQIMDNMYDHPMYMKTTVHPFLASNLIVQKCDMCVQMALDKEIDISLSSQILANGFELSVNVANVGAFSGSVLGTVEDGTVLLMVTSPTEQMLINGQLTSSCQSLAACGLNMDLQLPNGNAISSENKLSIQADKAAIQSITSAGSKQLLRFDGMVSEEQVAFRIEPMSSYPRVQANCEQTIISSQGRDGGAKCEVTYNDKFGEVTFERTRRGLDWSMKSNMMAMEGTFNMKKEFRVQVFTFPASIFSEASQQTSKRLGSYEIFDLRTSWPVMKSGDRKMFAAVEYDQRTLFRTELALADSGRHTATLVIPMIDAKIFYEFEFAQNPLRWSYAHQVLVNPKKLRRALSETGLRFSTRDIQALLDGRGLIFNKFDLEYPSQKTCSTQAATTPDNSVVSRVYVGSNMVCFSANDKHVGMKASPRQSGRTNWEFDLLSGVDLKERVIYWQLLNNQLSTLVRGVWEADLSSPDKTLAVQTTLRASGALLDDNISTSVLVKSTIENDDINAVVSGTYNEHEFEYSLTGELATVNVAGVQMNALLLHIPESDLNILQMHEIKLFYQDQVPTGLSVSQSSFVAEWMVDPQNTVVYMSLTNSDPVIPLAESSFRGDLEGIQILVRSTAPVVNFNLDWSFGESLKTELVSSAVRMTIAPMRRSHRFLLEVDDFGSMKADLKATSPYVEIIELGIDTTTNNFEIIEGINTSGKTRIVADRNGLKSEGMKVHQVFHIFGFDLKLDSQIKSKGPDSHTPTDEYFKWCNLQGDISYVWLSLAKQTESLGSFGTWVTMGSELSCQNTIAIVGSNIYHQLASTFTSSGIVDMRVEVPTSYKTDRALVIQAQNAERRISSNASLKNVGAINAIFVPGELDLEVTAAEVSANSKTTWSTNTDCTGTICQMFKSELSGQVAGASLDGSKIMASIDDLTHFRIDTIALVDGANVISSSVSLENGQTIDSQLKLKDWLSGQLNAQYDSIEDFSVSGVTRMNEHVVKNNINSLNGRGVSIESVLNNKKMIDIEITKEFLGSALVDLRPIRPVYVSISHSENAGLEAECIVGEHDIKMAITKPVRNESTGMLTINCPAIAMTFNAKLNMATFAHSMTSTGDMTNVAQWDISESMEMPVHIRTNVKISYVQAAHSYFSDNTNEEFAFALDMKPFNALKFAFNSEGVTVRHTSESNDWPSKITSQTAVQTPSHNIAGEFEFDAEKTLKFTINADGVKVEHETLGQISPLRVRSSSSLMTSSHNMMAAIDVEEQQSSYVKRSSFNIDGTEIELESVLGKDLDSLSIKGSESTLGSAGITLSYTGGNVYITSEPLTMKCKLDLKPLDLAVSVQSGEHTFDLSATKALIKSHYNNVADLEIAIGNEIRSALNIGSDRKYQLVFGNDGMRVIGICQDPLVGQHQISIELENARFALSSSIPTLRFEGKAEATLNPLEIVVASVLNSKAFNFELSQPKMLLEVDVAKQTLHLQKTNSGFECDIKIDNIVTLESSLEQNSLRVNAIIPEVEFNTQLMITNEPVEITMTGSLMKTPFEINASERDQEGSMSVDQMFALNVNMPNDLVRATLNIVNRGQYNLQVSTNSVNGALAIEDATIGTIKLRIATTTGDLSISSPIVKLETELSVDMRVGYTLAGSFKGVDFNSNLNVPEPNFELSVPKFGAFALAAKDSIISNKIELVNVFTLSSELNLETGVAKSSGHIFNDFELEIAGLDLYHHAKHDIAMVMGENPRRTYSQNRLINFENSAGVSIEMVRDEGMALQVNVAINPEMYFKYQRAQDVFPTTGTLQIRYYESRFQLVEESQSERRLNAVVNGVNVEGYVKHSTPIVIDLAVTIDNTKYIATYKDNRLTLSVPQVCNVDLEIAGNAARGTISTSYADITVNNIVVSEMNVFNTIIYVPTDIDMTAALSGFVVNANSHLTDNGVTYAVNCDLGSGATFEVEGITGGVIKSIMDPASYKIKSEMKLAVGTSYISQEFAYALSLNRGAIDAELSINTALVQGVLQLGTQGLTLNVLAAKDVLLNTKIGENSIFASGGVSYRRNDMFAIHQTVVKIGSEKVFLIGGGAQTPIFVDLAKMTMKPNDNLVIQLLSLRMEAAFESRKNFSIQVQPYVQIVQKGRKTSVAVDISGVTAQSVIQTDRKNYFKQQLVVKQNDELMVKGEHTINMKKQNLNINWRILDNTVKIEGDMDSGLNVDIRTAVAKLVSQLTQESFDMKMVAASVKVDAHLTSDLTNNQVTIATGQEVILNAQIDTLENVVVTMNVAPFSAKFTAVESDLDLVLQLSDLGLEVNCKNYCKSAVASLFNGGAKVLDISLESDVQRNIYTLMLRSNIAQVQLHLNQSADSKLMINYKDLVLIEAQANRNELIKLAVQSRDYGSFSANEQEILMTNPKLGLEFHLVIGEKLTFVFNPNDQLFIDYEGIRGSRSHTLKMNIYDLVVVDSQLRNNELHSKIEIYQILIDSIVSSSDATFAITGDNVNISGAVTKNTFNASIVEPETLRSSLEYSDEVLTLTTKSRIFTVTSENDLLKISPAMRY